MAEKECIRDALEHLALCVICSMMALFGGILFIVCRLCGVRLEDEFNE